MENITKGFIAIGTILSFAKALKKRNINYQNSLLVEATDISDVCVYMTYIRYEK